MKINNSNTQVENDYIVYTGVHKISVLGVNLNNEELKKLGFNVKEDAKEPEFLNVKVGEDKVFTRIRFAYLFRGKIMIDGVERTYNQKANNLEFLISNRDNISANGNIQHINDYGATAYSSTKDNPKMAWFWEKPNRVAKEGEAFLINFLKIYLNVAPKDECKLNWEALVKGDTKEISNHLKLVPTNECYALLGYKEYTSPEGKNSLYQSVFNNAFVRGNKIGYMAEFVKLFANYTGGFNYQNDFNFKPFMPKIESPTPDTTVDDVVEDVF